jgi:hypothetical protein
MRKGLGAFLFQWGNPLLGFLFLVVVLLIIALSTVALLREVGVISRPTVTVVHAR